MNATRRRESFGRFRFGLAFAVVAAPLIGAPHDVRAQAEITPQSVARAYGLDAWDSVERLDYTFNVQMPGRTVKRKWTWNRVSGEVTCRWEEGGEAKSRTYRPASIGGGSPEEDIRVDKWFINDSYWLLFPLHIVWDTATVSDEGFHPIPVPLQAKSAKMFSIVYPKSGGYTPGDIYDIFVDENHRLCAWHYRRARAIRPTLTTTWENHQTFGPLTFALEHKNVDGSFRLWFSDVEVMAKGDTGAQSRPSRN